ncbi:hypothetical protein [Lacticaseibacillus camelliae]|uniref:hypothetical protein n=1 Tax=Lacticaseibacillus camelliae TaxID=381742 RepID=UPI0006D2BD48|nr:hypothetical protein [Lacticaseibacillus camelliae]
MSKLELSWEALHRFNPALKFSVYRSGIEEFADEASATEAKNRWANIGREIILAKIKLYCLQDIHVNLAGFEAIEEESVTSVYAALYQQLIACFNNAKTSDKSLRRRRVDRLIGFLAAEIDSGMVGQFLTPTILKESVRQILPAEEALKRYEKKNPGLLGRKVTVITSGVHVRLEFRQRSAVGEGLDVKEAESIAQERLADLLYDGELPTLRATYPQTSRQMHEPTEKMLKWAQIFNISDDLVSRILILDARNETMDSLIESIGHNLCAAYCYSNPDSDFSESASDAVKSLVKAVIHLPKLAEAPFLLIGRQRDIQIQPRILNRMFFLFESNWW